MKALVTQYHALNIAELARGQWLDPCSKYDWVSGRTKALIRPP